MHSLALSHVTGQLLFELSVEITHWQPLNDHAFTITLGACRVISLMSWLYKAFAIATRTNAAILNLTC